MHTIYAMVFSILAGMLSCNRSTEEDPLVAQVFDQRLYASEVRATIPAGINPEDSLLMYNAYIDRWIKESVMMHEAEKNIPTDLQISKLVEDYRSSLVMHQYEKTVVESLLDTAVVEEELLRYYEANKSQYVLESTIVRCHFIKVPTAAPKKAVQKMEKIWRERDRSDKEFNQLLDLCNQHAATFYLSDSIWYKLELISQAMPSGAVNENVIRSNEVFQLENEDYYYFLKILDIRDKKEIAPLPYIREQAKRVILHQRKLALLEEIKEDLYQRAASRDNIKIYTQ